MCALVNKRICIAAIGITVTLLSTGCQRPRQEESEKQESPTPSHTDGKRLIPVKAQAGQAQAGIIPLLSSQQGGDYIYLIDTNRQTISVYERKPSNDLYLVGGRSYEYDREYLQSIPGKYLRYRSKGYDEEVAKFLQGINDKIIRP